MEVFIMSELLNAIKNRRSIYAISKDSPLNEAEIQQLINEIVEVAPSAFNSQSSRLVVLFGDKHQKFWDLVETELRKHVPEAHFAPTKSKLDSFAAGFGTILYFDEETVTHEYAEKFKTYAEHFTSWAAQSSAILQFAIWTALEDAGLGASVQHYNPLVDEVAKAEFGLPTSWKLIAQMPFGGKVAEAGEKTSIPVEERVRVLK
jgi:predicted oxidoreductase (fatty acid repression mutant protein)